MSETPTDEDPTFVDVVLTCRVEGCLNAGIPITLNVPDDCAAYVCGACGTPIADVT